MTEPRDPLEQELVHGLAGLVEEVPVPEGLIARARAGAAQLARARRRRRTAAIGGGAALGMAAVVLLGLVALADDDNREVRTVDDATSTTERSTTTTATSTTAAPDLAAPEEEGDVTAPSVAPTTTTTEPPPEPACAEATGEPSPPLEDWATWYQTEPLPDQPAWIRMCIDDVTPKVGQTVRLTIVGSDPDAVFGVDGMNCGFNWDFGGKYQHNWHPLDYCRDDYYTTPPPEEPVPTPNPEPGHVEQAATTEYMRNLVGPVTVASRVWSGQYDGWPLPYASLARASIRIVVHE